MACATSRLHQQVLKHDRPTVQLVWLYETYKPHNEFAHILAEFAGVRSFDERMIKFMRKKLGYLVEILD